MSDHSELTPTEKVILDKVVSALEYEGVDTQKLQEIVVSHLATVLCNKQQTFGFEMENALVTIDVRITPKPRTLN